MKKIFKKIINSIQNFFNKMADQEAERVINYYSQIFNVKPDEGGVSKKIKIKASQKRKLCSNN